MRKTKQAGVVAALVAGILLTAARLCFRCSGSMPNGAEPQNFPDGAGTGNETLSRTVRFICDGPSHEEYLQNLRKLKNLRFELERDGAWAEVSCLVKDRFGNPVPDADIRLFFDTPEDRPESDGVVEGRSGPDGRFFVKKKSTYACHWRVRKEGFHDAGGILPFSNRFSAEAGRKGRWTEATVELDVVLDERSGAELIHGSVYWDALRFPADMWIGFDFEAADCVEPFGKGKKKHIFFRTPAAPGIREAFRAGNSVTNALEVRIPGGGVAFFSEKADTSMPFRREAPDRFDTDTAVFVFVRSRTEVLVDSRMKKGEYMVFRTASDDTSKDGFRYGIIRNLEFWPGGLRMEYFLNKTPGDRRIDADVTSKLDFER